jgi:cytochrome c peroxidase
MKKNSIKISLLFFTVIFTGLVLFSCNQQNEPAGNTQEQAVEDTLLAQVDTFCHFIKDDFQPAVVSGKASQEKLQKLFLKARILFKKFEWASEYFLGFVTKKVNGPPVQEVENADLMNPTFIYPIDPHGLQVMEEMLFPKYDTTKKKKLIKELNLLQADCKVYKTYFSKHHLPDWKILDAAKLEVFRILTLGITGYDNPLTLNSMEESAVSLKSLRNVLRHYTGKDQDSGLIRRINGAIAYLQENTDFDSFNRAKFITEYGNKISVGITKIEDQYGYPLKYNRMLRQDAKTLFDSTAFNVNAFAPGHKSYITEKKVQLGKKLFFDPSLSGPGTRSCASCHQPDKAFTDGLKKHTSIHADTLLNRNTPTLINAALQSNYFYDMRALTLEDQANDVIHTKAEMDGSLKDIVSHLRKKKTYRKLFSKAFPAKNRAPIDSSNVLNAIASYVRSLTKLNSRFDQYMRGDSSALTPEEIKGFNLFMGKAKCATCHFMPLFNGVTPPDFTESEAEVIGVPKSLTDSVIDPDLGWYNINGVSSYKHAFKTPTVRNIDRTAPYMHNGIDTTLEQVMEFYNNAGVVGLGIKLKNNTLPEDSLHLTDKEIDDIIAFMKSLDSR